MSLCCDTSQSQPHSYSSLNFYKSQQLGTNSRFLNIEKIKMTLPIWQLKIDNKKNNLYCLERIYRSRDIISFSSLYKWFVTMKAGPVQNILNKTIKTLAPRPPPTSTQSRVTKPKLLNSQTPRIEIFLNRSH